MANEMNTDEQTLRRLQQELHVEIIPGTEIMTQVAGVHFIEGDGSKVLVPQPTNNPADPLNWNRLWKLVIIGQIFLLSFSQSFGPLSIAPAIPHYIEAFHRPLPDILQFTGVCILALGFSNFVWVPIATLMGRRPCIILSTVVCLVGCVLRAKSKNYNWFLGASVMHGFGAGPSETLPTMLIADVFFLHERGTLVNIYMWAFFAAVMLGGIIAGPMSDSYGWQSFWWLNVALYGVTLILQVLFLPETKWKRHASEAPPPSSSHSSGSPSDSPSNGDKTPPQPHEVERSAPVPVENHIDNYLHKGTPIGWQFTNLNLRATPKEVFLSVWVPCYIFFFPIVQWASFVFSWASSCFLVVNLTQSQRLAAPPYDFPARSVGLTNFAMLAGISIGMVTAGPLSDWISMRATVKNRGIREPEMRLPTLIPYACCTFVGTMIVAYGYQQAWRWEVIVIIGYTLIGIQTSTVSSIAVTYAIDCYKPVTGEFLVSTTIYKNLWGYGVSKFLTNWIINDGYVIPLLTNMAICMGFILLAIPLYYKGKTVRRWTKDSYVHKR